MSKKGFTLVELLVVISIIGILSAIGLVLYSSVLKQGRDSKRQSDLKSIQLALEQYNNDQSHYPANLGSSLTFGTKIYMNTVPAYAYIPFPPSCTTACTSYCLYADLENTSPGKPAACTAAHNFAVAPP